MSTLRVSNIEAKADPSSSTVDEQVKITNSNGDVLLYVDGRTSGITTVGINTTAEVFKVDSYKNFEYSGIITAASFSGPIDASTGTFSGDVTISGDLGVAGTLTYEDVTRVDAVGLSTFREGFGVGPLAGIALTAYKDGSIRTSGIITASSFSGSLAASNLTGSLPAISGANLTGINTAFGSGTSINTSGIITATAFIPSAGQLSHRNIIINGGMKVAQRSISKAITAGGFHTVDRFKTVANSSMTYAVTMSQENDNPLGNGKSVKLLTTTAKTPSGSENYCLRYTGEEQDISGAGFGTSSCKQLTISFSVKTNKTGTHGFQIYINNNQPNMTVAYTVSSANTWERKTITFPTYTTSYTHNSDGAKGFMIDWNLASGPDDIMAPYNWANGSTAARGVSGQVNMLDTVGNYFQLTNVQLEVGSVATPFENRIYADELKRCERYFQLLLHPDSGTEDMGSGFASSANEVQFPLQFKTEMRANPSVWQVSGSNYFLIGAGSYGGDKYLSASWNVNTVSRISGSLYTDPDANLSSHVSSMGLIQGKSTSARLALTAEL